MAKTLAELDAMLDALQAGIPAMLEEYPDIDEFTMAFAGEADVIEDAAGEHALHVGSRITCMLGSAGIIPSDNEGEPCP